MSNELWYANAEYWTVGVAILAIVLSQLPPVITWLRPGRLKVEVDERFSISHFLGHPNCQGYVSLTNTGARPARVKKIWFEITSPNGTIVALRATGFFQAINSDRPLAIFPFSLQKGSEWAHLTNGVTILSDSEEARINGLIVEVQTLLKNHEIQQQNSPTKLPPLIPAGVLATAREEFNKSFYWERGEYQLEVIVEGEKIKWRSHKYRFTVFESVVAQLRGHVNAYYSGSGIDPRMQLPGAPCKLKPM